MGAAVSRTAQRYPRGTEVRKSAAEDVKSSLTAEMGKENQISNEKEAEANETGKLAKDPETLTPTTSSDPQANRGVQTLLHRTFEDDMDVKGNDRVASETVSQFIKHIHQLDEKDDFIKLSARYQLSPHVAQTLAKYLGPPTPVKPEPKLE
ncbi:hypothetical protein H4219_001075 [Mycoemilia scoparia]|uniref:Uncharacterized protein n=1 Tax=Mycoemilia scoparia TaxID=417184 RepID=A0A9W8DWJ9_9FUNG|nr:hypothetical protein H4219_001075 [Mycoemilia scoparia]